MCLCVKLEGNLWELVLPSTILTLCIPGSLTRLPTSVGVQELQAHATESAELFMWVLCIPLIPPRIFKILTTAVSAQEHFQTYFFFPGWMEPPVHVCLFPDTCRESCLLHQIDGYSIFNLAGKTEFRHA